MVRIEILELQRLGPLPSDEEVLRSNLISVLKEYEKLLRSIQRPVTDDEARILSGLFSKGDCFGVDWTLLHLIETAPGWPIGECLVNVDNEWIRMLKDRAERWREAGCPARSIYNNNDASQR